MRFASQVDKLSLFLDAFREQLDARLPPGKSDKEHQLTIENLRVFFAASLGVVDVGKDLSPTKLDQTYREAGNALDAFSDEFIRELYKSVGVKKGNPLRVDEVQAYLLTCENE